MRGLNLLPNNFVVLTLFEKGYNQSYEHPLWPSFGC